MSLWGKGSARAVVADRTWLDRLSWVLLLQVMSFVRQRYIYVANADHESTERLLR
jgi:hypothetical protein